MLLGLQRAPVFYIIILSFYGNNKLGTGITKEKIADSEMREEI